MTEYIKPIIPEERKEVPDRCDTCGSETEKEPVTKVKDHATFGKITMVIGYYCLDCETGHLYQ